jgi:hypothetical protein
LSCAKETIGEFIWMLGDDDLVLPDAFVRINEQLTKYPELNGHVACHAYARDRLYNDFNLRILNDSVDIKELYGHYPAEATSLIRKDVSFNRLETLEETYKYTDVGAALCFMSNVIFRRSSWDKCVDVYLEHCKGREELSDTITTAGYMCAWGEFLIGKPVGLIPEPMVIAFIGEQAFLSRWPLMYMVFFLDVSRHFLKFGADPNCIRLYQRNIYRNSKTIAELATSKDPYVIKHFSIKKLIFNYGDDPELWISLLKAIKSAEGGRNKLKIFLHIQSALLSSSRKYWLHAFSAQRETMRKVFINKLKKMLHSGKDKYSRFMKNKTLLSVFRQVIFLSCCSLKRFCGKGKLPDFVIIGAQKAGTSSLWHNLNMHPNIEMHYLLKSNNKNNREVDFFCDIGWEKGVGWYKSLFNKSTKLQGEKSPSYISSFKAHERMFRVIPDAKLILILIDPVYRAFSSYNQQKRTGIYWHGLTAEEGFDMWVNLYLAKDEKAKDFISIGFYIDQIEHLLKFYRRDQLLILITEKMKKNFQETYNKIFDFLEIKREDIKYNFAVNVQKYDYTLNEETKRKLKKIYKPYNERLFNFLGCRIKEWEAS